MKDTIRERARELGFDDCRFTSAQPPHSAPHFRQWLSQGHHGQMTYLERNAHKRIDPQQVLPGAKSVICLALVYTGVPDMHYTCGPARALPLPFRRGEGRGEGQYDADTLSPSGEPASPTGVVARYARYTDYHAVMAQRLASLTDYLQQIGGQATRSLWYVDTGPVLERNLAQRAGLGFIGKHTNLVSRRLGNWILLGEILTTLELTPDAPEPNRCGSCSRCMTACPTGAIPAPFQLDARRCISYLTIELKGSIPVDLRPLIGNRIYGCDDCLAACPWNRFAREGSLMKDHFRAELTMPNLLELLALDDTAFRKVFAGTPMLRTKRRGVLRNACVALGNIGDPRALPALERAANDPEPLIAEHARWAIEQIRARTEGFAPVPF